MAFTSTNDINILSSADAAVVGAGAGNDTYIVSPGNLPTSTQVITISDTLGTNKLQLIGGLTIASSKVAVNAIQLKLSNGATININGADSFTFEIGGDPLLGTPGTVQTFAQFVTTSLGLAAVPTGTTVSDGAANVGVNANGTTTVPGAATYALAAGAASANEGTTATFNLVTTGLAAGAQVAYTLSGIDAADLASGALTGMATVGADGKATISVALAADNKTEGAETLTVTAGGQSASTVVNDTSVALGYTLTASATNLVEEGQQITFTVTPTAVSATAVTLYVQISGASVGAITTQATADDFSAVLLPVTIPAGSMAPVVVSTTVTADATTEGPEGFQAKLLDSAFVVVPDVAALTGTITEGVSTVKTFMLTAGVDTVAGASGNDTINAQAVDATGAAKTTLSGFDAIDGGVGTDTLNIYTTGTENATFPATATVKNVEVVNVYNTAAAAALGDASKFEGVTQLWQHGTNAADVSKLAATTTAGFKAVEATVAADLDVSAADTATTVTIALDGVKGDAATGGGTTENRADIDVDGAALNAVTVSGTLAAKTTAAAAKEVFTATFGAATTAGHLSFDGVDVTTIPIGTAANVAAAFVAGYNASAAANWVAVDNLDGTVTFTGKVAGGKTDVLPADFDPHGMGSDAAVTAVSVTTQGVDGAAPSLALNVTSGKDVESLSVNTAVTTTLSVTENAGSAGTKDVRSLDASSSVGGITFAGTVTGGAAGSLATIKTGAGADTVTIATATLKDDAATTTVNEAVSALLETGAGNDKITINTTGTGTTNVEAGAGDDTVTLTADGSGILTVNLGAGNDIFKGAGAVSATDVINAGDGTDTLLLSMVGAANIGAFSNFETFDAAALAKTLDVEILAAKNTVTEFVATADVGAAAVLTNVGAGVGYRVTGDTNVANALTLTQKTAGALTVTLDIDEAATTVASFDSGAKTNVDAAVVASNATSLKAVFDSAFKDAVIVGDASDNLTNLTLTGTKATSLEVVSGGAFAINDLVYTYGKATATPGTDGLLTSVTVSGDRAITLAFSDGTNDAESNIATVNASTLTGALTLGLDDLKATGTVTLGSGADVITAQTGLTAATVSASADATAAIAAHRALSSFQKGTVEDATAQGAFDVVKLTGAVQAADVAATATHTVKDGKFTFNGSGPATLDAAVELVAGIVAVNGAVVFEYVGNSYIFAEGATNGGVDDVLIKLTGVTGLAGLDDINNAGTNLYVF